MNLIVSGLSTGRNGNLLIPSLVYYSIWNKPIAVAPWNNSQEGGSAAEWAQAFINRWKSPLPILSAGAYAVPIPLYEDYPDTNYLINEAYNASVKAGTKSYCTHLYALSSGTTLSTEMNHLRTVSDLSHFVDKIATAKSINRPYIIGKAILLSLGLSFFANLHQVILISNIIL